MCAAKLNPARHFPRAAVLKPPSTWAFVSRVNRRIDIRIVRFCRSTKLVETCSGSGYPVTRSFLQPMHSAGLYRFFALSVAPVNLHQHRVIDVPAERTLDRFQVRLEGRPVVSLDATGETTGQIVHDSRAHAPSRDPTNQLGTSLESASIAVHVQTSP